MKNKRWIMIMYFVACLALLLVAATSQAAPIPGSAGEITMQDGPNTSGDSFEVLVTYEAFDGLDTSDPLGITPGKKQFAYILEYVSGNKKVGFFDVESINGVPIIEAATSTNGTVNGVLPGTEAPLVSLVITQPSNNPAARFVYKEAGLSSFGLVGVKSVILAFTTDESADIQTSLAQIVDTSLSTAEEVVGPAECSGTIQGTVFCLDCDPEGQIVSMEGVTVKAYVDGNEVASAVTGETGLYQMTELGTGTFTVAIDDPESYIPCSTGSVDVNVECNGDAVANFCVCPPPCTQEICVKVVCNQDGNEVAVPYSWVGICGPKIALWRNTGKDGIKCFVSQRIVPGHYKVKVKPPRGYQLEGPCSQEFDLADCETKELVFYACPIPPCVESVCVSVVENVDGNEVPVEGVKVKIKKTRCWKTETTDSGGFACFDDLKEGHYIAKIEIPEGYRMCDGDNKTHFALERCEHEDVTFVLCKIELGPCPMSPRYWKNNPEAWPVTEMWIGADYFEQDALINILSGKKADGSYASSRDMSIKLAKLLIAVKLNLANGSAPKDIDPVVIAADEFLLYDYPPGVCPRGKSKNLARQLKNTLEEYINDQSFCEPVE